MPARRRKDLPPHLDRSTRSVSGKGPGPRSISGAGRTHGCWRCGQEIGSKQELQQVSAFRRLGGKTANEVAQALLLRG